MFVKDMYVLMSHVSRSRFKGFILGQFNNVQYCSLNDLSSGHECDLKEEVGVRKQCVCVWQGVCVCVCVCPSVCAC